MKKDSSIAAIVNFLCILKDDILLYNFQPSKVFDQVYFIAYGIYIYIYVIEYEVVIINVNSF